MNPNIHRLLSSLANRWALLVLACLLGLQLGVAPAVAQESSSLSAAQKKKLKKQLQQTYQEGAKAGQSENYEEAVTKFEESIQLAQKLGLSNITARIRNNLIKSLKGAASADLDQENYEGALSHYEKVLQYEDSDAGVHYNRGIAYLSIDSTDAGLQSLQQAIQVGNETGNTRVAGRATERIRDEFLAKASKALQGDNPSNQQITTALDALDRMREFVDPNADALFYRALALFESDQLQQAVQTAREGLDMHEGSRSDAAKFYFVIGESQMTLGNKAEACRTFENATYGDYKARAEHFLKNECEDV